MWSSADEQSAALREALWVSRCVGNPETSPLTPGDINSLAQSMRVRELEAGEPLQRAGAEPTAVRIVRHGCLELAVGSGRGRMVIQTLRPGAIDGDIQLLLGIDMPYETRANTPTTCLLLPRAEFDDLLAHHPQLSRRWLTSVAERLARSHHRLTSLLGQPLEAQLAQLLLDESDPTLAGQGMVQLPQATLAALVGAQRQSVNRVLRRFAEDGLVEVAYRQVTVLDRSALRQVTGTR